MKEQTIWTDSKDRLVATVTALGFPAALGEEIAKHLGSPKAIERMNLYLQYSRPKDATIIVDEMLAIREEIDAWREKKESFETNVCYNELLNNGFSDDN